MTLSENNCGITAVFLAFTSVDDMEVLLSTPFTYFGIFAAPVTSHISNNLEIITSACCTVISVPGIKLVSGSENSVG
jgi:hypothetical protein